MHILQINSADNWGGGEAHTYDLCRKLAERGYSITLACRQGSSICLRSKSIGLKTFELPLKGAIDIVSIVRLASYCKKNKVSIIHAHLGRDYWIAFFAKLLYPALRIVLTRHVLFPFKDTIMRRMLIKNVDKFIAVSTLVKKTLLQNQYINEDKIAIIANGIDIDLFIRQNNEKIPDSSNQPMIGIVGQVSKNKGQDIFLKSIPYVIREFPQAKFVIVGSDYKHENFSRQLKSLSQQLGITSRVDFIGFSDDTIGIMQQLDILVLCSEKESFGLVVIEAMLCGKPVIVSDCGGIDDIVENNVNGLIVPYGDPKSLAKAVTRILSDNNLSKLLAMNGKKTVCDKFTLNQMVAEVTKIYDKLSMANSFTINSEGRLTKHEKNDCR